ncbi:argininosuccinate lyase [Pullulanibacillus camelliae]|uniref:Argininosuccinate lyase n=1 Tax=Pullulanibacillus camelliae TaxID=1707096 RepID=A0A8J2YFW6_9BACL|nr:argininosuccinate lyase [Pullulanibacillus camelliae]GGE30888.1 argininosuccinate lyase [Pullulanibacillus camelliae]
MGRKHAIFAREGDHFPGVTYSDVVLRPAYENAKCRLLEPMLEINKAHLVMLAEQSLLTQSQVKNILEAIDSLNLDEIAQSQYTGQYEDLFFYVESKIIDHAGQDGGSLHLARSRNDMGVAMYRMTLRQQLLQAIEAIIGFQEVLLDVSEEHNRTLFMGYTHTQQAQPMTFAHYLLAIYDVVDRDLTRLLSAYDTCNKSPLGAAALTTSGFPIHRQRMAELLGFDGLIENSYDAIAGADYLGEIATSVKLTFINFGRFIQDLLLWSTQEFGILEVADPYVQISSIMPQKRNPVSLEHLRALSSSGLGSADTVLQMIHNTPFGDINDTEDDLQPHLWQSLKRVKDVFQLAQAVIGTVEVNKEVVTQRIRESYAIITELADTLVREAYLPFRTAHTIVSRLVKQCIEKHIKPYEVTKEVLNEVSQEIVGKPLNLSEEQLQCAVDPVHFVEIRKLPGGPAFCETKRMRVARKNELKNKTERIEGEKQRMKAYKMTLEETTNIWSNHT